ncbi:hypothetical protein AS188_03890 [Kocuria flava]|nr:hypothetical protein AS188_03890 [Kocuria flava]
MAAQKLANGKWRLRHSAWLLAPILGLGLFSWVGFVYVAARTRKRRWWVIAAIYAGLGVLLFVLDEAARSTGVQAFADVGGLLLLGTWVGGVIHAFILNKEYLRWRASLVPWYTEGAPPQAPPADLRQPGQPSHSFQGIDNAAYYQPGRQAPAPGPRPWTPPPPRGPAQFVPPAPASPPASRPAPVQFGRVHVNTATAQDLARLPGIDEVLAQHILSVRKAQGRFRDDDDFVRSTGLQPHQYTRIAHLVTVDAPTTEQRGPRQGPPGGRILDI